MTADIGDGLDVVVRIGHEARPVIVGLAFFIAERRDRFGLGDLMGEHVAERSEFADLELAVTHRFDLGIVIGGDEDLHRAAELLADHGADLLVDWGEARRRVEWFDSEPHRAAIDGAIFGDCRPV